eukprot:TRINITY_DN6007_c0_g2_i5.p1 TRINITY_DN6007_c0_g2~~TRINITY_DN6007_c0_g2_i5.p1  ORF type:complete len:269 (+),score=11.72 TRINITY_DN6007_c0_g2_i5:266-1072(+)
MQARKYSLEDLAPFANESNSPKKHHSTTNLGTIIQKDYKYSLSAALKSAVIGSKCPLPIPKRVLEKLTPLAKAAPSVCKKKSVKLCTAAKSNFRHDSSSHTLMQTENSILGSDNTTNSSLFESSTLCSQLSKKLSLKSADSFKARRRSHCLEKIITSKVKKQTSDFVNLSLQQELKASDKPIWIARFSPNGNFFATGGEDNYIKIWKIPDYSQQCNFTLKTHSSGVIVCGKSDEGVQRACGSGGGLGLVQFGILASNYRTSTYSSAPA